MTSIARQVTRATLLVAAMAMLVLAGAAAVASRFIFEADEAGVIRRSALALSDAVQRELVETKSPIEAVAQDSIDESALADYAVEIWNGETRIASNRPAETVGRGPKGVVVKTSTWLSITVVVAPNVALVVAAPRDRGARASRVFAWSLVLAAPFALGVALWVGRRSARQVTGPLLAFRDRFSGAGLSEPVGPPAVNDPAEVAEMDAAFRAQWRRVKDSFDREREFAANAAHELRTPLTRLRLLAERIRESPVDAPDLAARQIEEVARTSRLVDALLVLARSPESGLSTVDTVNLADLVRSGAAHVLEAEQGAELDVPDEAMVRGDEDLLRIAVANLLDNARKFGSIEGRPAIHLRAVDGAVRLSVTTPGARIEGPARALLFERFYRSPEARAETAGHGLGLSLARHIALMHGGDVTLTSLEGADASFLLALPAWKPE